MFKLYFKIILGIKRKTHSTEKYILNTFDRKKSETFHFQLVNVLNFQFLNLGGGNREGNNRFILKNKI